MNDNYINAFLEGGLTEKEEQAIREAMSTDEVLAAQIGQRKLEMLIVDELDMQYWGKKVAFQEKSFKKQARTQRIVAYAAAAMIAAIAVFFLAFPPTNTTEYTGPIAFATDYNTNLKSLTITEDFPAEMLQGVWMATINEQPGLILNLELSVSNGSEFSIDALYTLNNLKKDGNKISARGTYTLNGKQLTLNLDESSIKRAAGASPFETAPIEIWLKSKRLFKQETEIVGLTNNNLILKYGPGEGLEWKKK
ncbi:MAG: hypothetical protein R2788_10500 [Saprospiraceae bacterium]